MRKPIIITSVSSLQSYKNNVYKASLTQYFYTLLAKSEQFSGMRDEGDSPMRLQKVAVAESPKNTDAG